MRGLGSFTGDTEIKTIFVTTEADVYRSDSRTMCGKRGTAVECLYHLTPSFLKI